jgi:hypothetical protein
VGAAWQPAGLCRGANLGGGGKMREPSAARRVSSARVLRGAGARARLAGAAPGLSPTWV